MNKKFLSFIFVLSFIFLNIFISKVDSANAVLFPKEINQTGVTLRAIDLSPSTFYTFYITEKGKTTPLNNANVYSEPDGTAEASFQGLLPSHDYQAKIELQSEPEKTVSSVPFTTKIDSNSGLENLSIESSTANTVSLVANKLGVADMYYVYLVNDTSKTPNTSYNKNQKLAQVNGTAKVTFDGLIANNNYTAYIIKNNDTKSFIGRIPVFAKVASTPNPTGTPKDSIYKGGIVPECNTGVVDKATGQFSNPCDFKYFMDLLNNIIKFLLFAIATPMIALIVMYTGYLYLTAGGSAGQTEKAKHILFNVVIGYIIALAAWLIVNTIVTSLLPKGTDIDTFLSKDALVK